MYAFVITIFAIQQQISQSWEVLAIPFGAFSAMFVWDKISGGSIVATVKDKIKTATNPE